MGTYMPEGGPFAAACKITALLCETMPKCYQPQDELKFSDVRDFSGSHMAQKGFRELSIRREKEIARLVKACLW